MQRPDDKVSLKKVHNKKFKFESSAFFHIFKVKNISWQANLNDNMNDLFADGPYDMSVYTDCPV